MHGKLAAINRAKTLLITSLENLLISTAMHPKYFLLVAISLLLKLAVCSLEVTSSGDAEQEKDLFCRRVEYKVNLDKYDVFSSVVYPRTVDIGACEGSCSHINFINYYHLFRYFDQDQQPSSCCVPMKFKSLQMLFTLPDKGTVIETVEDAIVDQCGCY